MTPQSNDTCAKCGQSYEDHRKTTDQCPMPLENVGVSSRWDESRFTPMPSGYRKIRDFFDRPLDGVQQPLEDHEIKELIDIVANHCDHQDNVGIEYFLKRMKFDARETAFHDEWLKENEPRPGINYGHGVLQDIFMMRENGPMARVRCLEKINSRDRMIVATVIQWLGTNCGIGFLDNALARCGMRISQIGEQTRQ